VELFAEEVVRGGPAFAVSLILSSLEPALRAAAELGAWQIISPVSALGRVEVVNGLHEVQGKVSVLMQGQACKWQDSWCLDSDQYRLESWLAAFGCSNK